MKNDHRSKFSNLSMERRSLKKKNQGFIGALLYQLSYEATHWERGQFIKNELFHIYTSFERNKKKLTRNEILKKVIEIQAAKFENSNLYVRAC